MAISGDFARVHFKELMVLAFLARLLFLVAIPALSDDYFRFIWDGALTGNGINPYGYTPAMVHQMRGVALPGFMVGLKEGMNSPSYYSPYPPVLQLLFFISAKWGGYHLISNLVIFRLLGLLAEAATVYVGIKLLDHLSLPRQKILWYALNPLVIVELSGNLHGEVFMIFFLVLSFYQLIKYQYGVSAVLLGLAVATKLLPLIFLPVIISFIGVRKGSWFCVITVAAFSLTYLPFLNEQFVAHISESVGYYFQKFEFNASIYYILRWVGYDVTGFNLIYFTGRVLPFFSLFFICGLAFYKKISTTVIFFERLLFTLLIYYVLSLTVHPWYVTTLVSLSVLTGYRFAMVWSALIVLTYSTYLQKPYHEILWITALEYLLLATVLYYEIKGRATSRNG